MRSARFGSACLTLLLVALIGGLAPVAYASPPDPSWVRGMYDDADFDDVVGLITGGAGLVQALLPADLRPDSILLIALVPSRNHPVVRRPLCSPQPRAPPAV
jgi:hypothetical protein